MGRPATTEAAATAPDEDDAQSESGPLRRCVVTRERLPKERMIRFVVAPDRTLVPDLTGRLPGRGLWLSARGDVIENARSRGSFAKAARSHVAVPTDLAELLRGGLVRRVVEHLGLARRAGQAVGGFQKAREWVAAGRAGLVVEAADGSVEEAARLVGGCNVPVVRPLAAADLGSAFGRDHLVHVAVLRGRLAETLRIEAGRLAGVCGVPE